MSAERPQPQVEIPLDMKYIKVAVLGVSEQQWVNFFEFLRQQQYNKLRSAADDAERQAIQNTVKGFDLVQEKFSGMRDNKLDK